jgi:hypothetical protein
VAFTDAIEPGIPLRPKVDAGLILGGSNERWLVAKYGPS